MDELSPSRIWLMRGAYAALSLAVMFFYLLPLETIPHRWAWPDLMVALTFAWVMRRPDFVPIYLIAVVMLLADLLLQRPPGLWAALIVLGSEYLKNRFGGLSDASFIGEWVAVCIVVVAATLLNRLVLLLTAVDLTAVGLVLIQMVMTIAIYPFVVAVSRSVLGVRKLGPSDINAMGRRA